MSKSSSSSMSPYIAMCGIFSERVDFQGKSPVASPPGSPFDGTKLVNCVKQNTAFLPMDYRTAYAEPLAAALPTLCSQLRTEFDQQVGQGAPEKQVLGEITSMVDTLVGAVRDWGSPEYTQPLRRFEAVVSNLYRSFLSDEQRSKIQLPLKEVIPPLVTFAATADDGPFTQPADSVLSLINVPIGVVSLPGSYRDHPLLWPALAHETGGHDVVHADPGLEAELARGARNLKGLPKGVGALWSFWMDETVADVYGLLNVGPSFAVSLGAFFSALEHSFNSKQPLGMVSNVLPVQNNSLADPHPVDLLRLYVAQGVVSKLTGLSTSRINAWQSMINDIAHDAAGGKTTIDVMDVQTRSVVQQLPLSTMANAAQQVGAYIATARLHALGGHSIQEIETWDDEDEDASNAITTALAQKQPIVGLGDDAQLLAGATMAFYKQPSSYDAVTSALNDALDDSFARDPIFGAPAPHFMLPSRRRTRATGRSYHVTMRSLAALGLQE